MLQARSERRGVGGGLRLVAAVLVAGLATLTLLVSFLLFHTVAEVLFAVVGFGVLIMSLTLRQFLDDDFPVLIGIALGTAALMQLVHTVDFPGMNLISGDPDSSIQMWVAARLLLAVSFVVATFVIGRRLRVRLAASVYITVTLLVLASIFWWHVFPSALTDGGGPTRFKLAAEYAGRHPLRRRDRAAVATAGPSPGAILPSAWSGPCWRASWPSCGSLSTPVRRPGRT